MELRLQLNNEHMFSCITDLEVALGDGDLKDFPPQPHFPSAQMALTQQAPPATSS